MKHSNRLDIWRVTRGYWQGRRLQTSMAVDAEDIPAINRWFVGMWFGIATIVLLAGLATGHVWQALGLIGAISVPLGVLWFMLAPGQSEYSAGTLGEAEAALRNRPPSFGSEWGSVPLEGHSGSGYGCGSSSGGDGGGDCGGGD